VDVFSFALMLWEIATGKSLVDVYKSQCTNPLKWFKLVSEGVRPSVEGMNATVRGIPECCWDSDSGNRMGWGDILDNLATNRYDIFENVDQAAVDAYLRGSSRGVPKVLSSPTSKPIPDCRHLDNNLSAISFFQ
jgi:hypothetical protein